MGNGSTFRRNIKGPAEIRSALNVLAEQGGRAPAAARGLGRGGAGDHSGPGPENHHPAEAAAHEHPSGPGPGKRLLGADGEKLGYGPPGADAHRHRARHYRGALRGEQSLFDDAPKTDPKREKLEKSLDAIRKKYGRGAIGAGSILHNDMGLGELTIRPQEDEGEEEFDEKVKGPL